MSEARALRPHPAAPPRAITGVTARLDPSDADWLRIRWRIEPGRALAVPPLAGRARIDGLWRTTCFELFVARPDEPSYAEFNLSPSERWAAYDFTGYRAGMTQRPAARAPACAFRPGDGFALFDAALAWPTLPSLPWRYGLGAVIEEHDGTTSYWALAHGAGELPDFHDPACLAATLAPPARERSRVNGPGPGSSC